MESTFLFQIVFIFSGIFFGISIACLAFAALVVKVLEHDE